MRRLVRRHLINGAGGYDMALDQSVSRADRNVPKRTLRSFDLSSGFRFSQFSLEFPFAFGLKLSLEKRAPPLAHFVERTGEPITCGGPHQGTTQENRRNRDF